MSATRVKYDLLPPGAHTILPVEDRNVIDPRSGLYQLKNWERVDLGAVMEVEDINDPKSFRAYQVRGHLKGFGSPGQYGCQGPLATHVSGPGAPAGAVTDDQAPKEMPEVRD